MTPKQQHIYNSSVIVNQMVEKILNIKGNNMNQENKIEKAGILVEWVDWGKNGKRYNNATKIRVVEAYKTGIYSSATELANLIGMANVTVSNWIEDYDNGLFHDLAKNTTQISRKGINSDYVVKMNQEIKEMKNKITEKEKIIELAKQANDLGIKLAIA